jgi:hypothetical protein
MSYWLCTSVLLGLSSLPSETKPGAELPVGVVSHVKVVSDKVPDVSSLAAWRKSFLKDGMTDQEKALAVWRSTVMFQHQDNPPREYLTNEQDAQDPLKIFNVYGYSYCSVASCDIECLARYAGLRARGWGINAHSVPEVFWDGGWHMLDASLINYFPKPDGSLASVEDILAAIRDWYKTHPDLKGDGAKLRAFQHAGGERGWKQGPDLLSRSPYYDGTGWWPAHTHGWYSTMQEYDGTVPKDASRTGKPFLYEYGYSQGYQVNIQLRPGERLTRNWSNRGLHVNMKDGGTPRCMTGKIGIGALSYTTAYGDLAPGRVGNGTVEYDVPVRSSAYRTGALEVDNLQPSAVRVQDPGRPASLIVRMPSSYVYLTGALTFTATVGSGGEIVVSFSDNNGLDWRELARVTSSGMQQVDLSPLVLRRYDYRLKFALKGADTGFDALKVVHDVQHSQRALPALAQGANTITFSAGPTEGTMTVEGATDLSLKDKQLTYADFHPTVSGFDGGKRLLLIGPGSEGSITFPITTPGDLVRLRFGGHYCAYDAEDGLDLQVSFDRGANWKTVDRAVGPTRGHCLYVECAKVPAGTREALVRYSGTRRNTTGILNFRIDADYREPSGGFRPVKVTYIWEENGQSRQDVHVARSPQESYVIQSQANPLMKSIVLELAD